MKSQLIIALVALTWLCGCSTPTESGAGSQSSAKFLGVQATPWGHLEAYGPSGVPELKNGGFRLPRAEREAKVALLLLVGPNGEVLNSTVEESSGDGAIDEAARAMFVGARFPKMPDYRDAEPYVVRFVVKTEVAPEIPSMSDYSR